MASRQPRCVWCPRAMVVYHLPVGYLPTTPIIVVLPSRFLFFFFVFSVGTSLLQSVVFLRVRYIFCLKRKSPNNKLLHIYIRRSAAGFLYIFYIFFNYRPEILKNTNFTRFISIFQLVQRWNRKNSLEKLIFRRKIIKIEKSKERTLHLGTYCLHSFSILKHWRIGSISNSQYKHLKLIQCYRSSI